MNKVVATIMSESEKYSGTPEITDINYDLWVLRVSVSFEAFDNPLYVEFEGVSGYRVLDEGDLQEYWADGGCSGLWLVSIEQGGWFDLEQKRPGFISTPDIGLKEYLVAGINECVSVIAYDKPTIRKPKP